jgi:hypothetical protein
VEAFEGLEAAMDRGDPSDLLLVSHEYHYGRSTKLNPCSFQASPTSSPTQDVASPVAPPDDGFPIAIVGI